MGAFLGDVQEAFKARYTQDECQSAIAYGMQQAFSPEIESLMDKYNSPTADRVTQAQEKLKHINDTLMESIDKLLERNERIELLVNRGESLSTSTSSFRREAVQLRRDVWWRNFKSWLVMGTAALIVILLLVFSTCGLT